MPKKTGKRGAKKAAKRKVVKTAKSVRKPAKKAAAKKKAVPKKKTVRKPAKPPVIVKKPQPPVAPKAAPVPAVGEQRAGIVTHFYTHLSVAVVRLDQGSLQVGDMIHIKGHTTDFQQRVDSMQIEHQSIQRAEPGQEFGMKVMDHVREHDVVYKVSG